MIIKHAILDTRFQWSPFFRAGGQPPRGTIFTQPGGGFGWNPGGMSASFTMSLSFGPVGISVSLGTIGGTTTLTRTNLVNVPVALYVQHWMEVREYQIWSRPRANPNVPWQLIRNIHTSSSQQNRFDIRIVH